MTREPSAGAARAKAEMISEPSRDVAKMLDEVIKTATPMGAYCMGRAIEASIHHHVQVDKELLESLRMQTSMRMGQVVLNRWITERVRKETPSEDSAGR